MKIFLKTKAVITILSILSVLFLLQCDQGSSSSGGDDSNTGSSTGIVGGTVVFMFSSNPCPDTVRDAANFYFDIGIEKSNGTGIAWTKENIQMQCDVDDLNNQGYCSKDWQKTVPVDFETGQQQFFIHIMSNITSQYPYDGTNLGHCSYSDAYFDVSGFGIIIQNQNGTPIIVYKGLHYLDFKCLFD